LGSLVGVEGVDGVVVLVVIVGGGFAFAVGDGGPAAVELVAGCEKIGLVVKD